MRNISQSFSGATGGSWKRSPMKTICTPPKGCDQFLRTCRSTRSILSSRSQRTILTSSIMSNSNFRSSFSFVSLSFRLASSECLSSAPLCLPKPPALPGTKGLKGSCRKECIVSPPAFIAATPVGATIALCLVVWVLMYFKKVVLPVPALPVRKRFSSVSRTKVTAFSKIEFEVSGCSVTLFI